MVRLALEPHILKRHVSLYRVPNGPARPAKRRDMHGPLPELTSRFVQIKLFLIKRIVSTDYTVESQEI